MKLLKINLDYDEVEFYLATDLHEDDVEVFILKWAEECEENGTIINPEKMVKALQKTHQNHEVMMFDDIIDLLI
jgi:hypothetical protein